MFFMCMRLTERPLSGTRVSASVNLAWHEVCWTISPLKVCLWCNSLRRCLERWRYRGPAHWFQRRQRHPCASWWRWGCRQRRRCRRGWVLSRRSCCHRGWGPGLFSSAVQPSVKAPAERGKRRFRRGDWRLRLLRVRRVWLWWFGLRRLGLRRLRLRRLGLRLKCRRILDNPG
jgi:hypothetical protein